MAEARIEWTEYALDDLAKLDLPIQKRILRKIGWFGRHFNNQTPEPLAGELSGTYKIRIGDWRVIYKLEQDIIVIYAIGHRKDVYKY